MTAHAEVSASSNGAYDHEFRMLINGELVSTSATVTVINPATEQPIAHSPVAGEQQVNDAVAAAEDAFPSWSRSPIEVRRASLRAIADAIEANAEEFARLTTLEQGKPLADARGDVEAAISFTRHFAEFPLDPEVLRDDETAHVELQRTPLGVVAAILPWNFPFFQAMYKIAPALITGNTLVVKPAPTTPLNTLRLGEVIADLLPAGVLNIVGDGGDVGPILTAHPSVKKVSFTGSTAVGRQVVRASADTLKRVTLELGGNDSAIVLEDCDIDKVADGIYKWAFANAGQVCISIKRIFVPESLYEPMCTALAERARATSVGDGMDDGTEMGPLQNAKQYEAAKRYLTMAKESGNVIAGGELMDGPGYFVQPTLVTGIADDNPLIAEETFGPVRPILTYRTLDEAIARANATPYGLGNSVWGNNLDLAAQVAQQLDSGTVWVNQHFATSADVPFGGQKQSGLGSEFGVDGVLAFTDIRVINISKV